MMPVRRFKTTNVEMTVELIDHKWFVLDRPIGELAWNTHCGPYSSMGAAIDWIMAIKEETPREKHTD